MLVIVKVTATKVNTAKYWCGERNDEWKSGKLFLSYI